MTAIPGNLPYCTHRYAIFVSYLGSRYSGSQRLTARRGDTTQTTVQEALEWALEQFLPKRKCSLTSASRTDAGVHANLNCFCLPLMDFSRPTEKMKRLMNLHLLKENHEVAVKDIVLMSNDFHPRKCCHYREYIFRLAVPHRCSIGLKETLTNLLKPIDLMPQLPINEYYKIMPVPQFDHGKALEVINLFNGEHDFRAFANIDKEERVSSTVRDIQIDLRIPDYQGVDVGREYPLTIYELSFKSKSFLRNQIRRMVGAMVAYATYNRTSLGHIKALLDEPSKNIFREPLLLAEPWGLYLNRLYYDQSVFQNSMRTHETDKTLKKETVSLETLGLLRQFVTDDTCDIVDEGTGAKNLDDQTIAGED